MTPHIGAFLAGYRGASVQNWALAGVFLCLGHIFGNVAFDQPPDTFRALTITASNLTSLFGYAFLFSGVRAFLGHSLPRNLFMGLLIISVLSVLIVLLVGDRPGVRVFIFSLLAAGCSTAAGLCMWRKVQPDLIGFQRTVAGILLINSVLLVFPATWLLLRPEGAQSIPRALNITMFLWAVLFCLSLGTSLLLLLFRVSELRLRNLARHDALTGLRNRHSLRDHASRELARAQRTLQPLTLLILDLDNFKEVNDEYGHAVGDEVLVEVASRLTFLLRDSDLLFRYGGEEFLILLPDTPAWHALDLAERLRCALCDQPLSVGDTPVFVSTSIGAVGYDVRTDDWDRMLSRADAALYRAKRNGRNRVESDFPGLPVLSP